MKVVLLAEGFGSRISEKSQFKPKPMIEIGGYHTIKSEGVNYALNGAAK